MGGPGYMPSLPLASPWVRARLLSLDICKYSHPSSPWGLISGPPPPPPLPAGCLSPLCKWRSAMTTVGPPISTGFTLTTQYETHLSVILRQHQMRT